MLSRLQFESAAQAFACRHPCWNWVDGHRPGYGYLTRSTNHFLISSTDGADSDWTLLQTDEVEDDPAAAVAQALNDTLTVDEYIVFSASFSVPAFYFTVHDTSVFVPLTDQAPVLIGCSWEPVKSDRHTAIVVFQN